MEKENIVFIRATPPIKKYNLKCYNAEYHEKNRSHRLKYAKIYYQENLDKFREKTLCDCGSLFTTWQKNRHYRTQKHKNYLQSLL
jgi:hypothetical protein